MLREVRTVAIVTRGKVFNMSSILSTTNSLEKRELKPLPESLNVVC